MGKIELKLSSENRSVPIFQYSKGEEFDYQTVIDRIDAGLNEKAFDNIDALHMLNWVSAAFKNSTPEIFEYAQKIATHILEYTSGAAKTQLRISLFENLTTHKKMLPYLQVEYWRPLFNQSFNNAFDLLVATQIAKNYSHNDVDKVYPDESIADKKLHVFLIYIFTISKNISKTNNTS